MSALSKVIHEVNWISIFTNQRKIDGRNLTVGDAIRIFKFINSEMQTCIGCETRPCNTGQVRIRLRQKCAERFMYADQKTRVQSAIDVHQN